MFVHCLNTTIALASLGPQLISIIVMVVLILQNSPLNPNEGDCECAQQCTCVR